MSGALLVSTVKSLMELNTRREKCHVEVRGQIDAMNRAGVGWIACPALQTGPWIVISTKQDKPTSGSQVERRCGPRRPVKRRT